MPYKDKEKEKEHRRLYYIKTKELRYCEHKKDRYRCKDCKGDGICEHNKTRTICKDCKGSAICEHNKNKKICRDCDGSAFCEHNKQKAVCRDCDGSGFCKHNKQKSKCKDCGGSSFCEHNRYKYTCKDCKGNGICEHNKQRRICADCGGSSMCEHKIQKKSCKFCNFSVYLVNAQRGRIHRIMKLTDIEKTKPSIEYLDCSIEFFKSFIETKMTPDMTFLNIQYDHIKPISKFNLDDPDELMKCCHYTNFQPLIGNENQVKGNKWCEEDEQFWNENIIYKDYNKIYLPL
jgi:hypothetical protein